MKPPLPIAMEFTASVENKKLGRLKALKKSVSKSSKKAGAVTLMQKDTDGIIL